ncbi:MAG: dihydroorotate dehydrogenase [Chloroflexi bacterium HGW-Chloroflexi-10]|nr:MAG: dihydroorotate dehydrogenase [Chloroflexi bacterium HGW-Chloroflexi-10]
MTELNTTYLGLNLKNPLVASASPLSKKLETVKKLEDAGIGAVVMYSLFEEQISHESQALDYFLSRGTESFAEAISYFPELDNYNIGPEEYLELIAKIKESVNIPVIGSLNGISSGGWVNYAKKIEQAGADALELNIYYIPTDVKIDSKELEDAQIELVADIKKQLSIPLSVKLGPYYSALPNFANRLVAAGANGLVLFNRFYQPDIDTETLEVVPSLNLSTSDELRLPLRWIAILYGSIKADLALTTGVHNEKDVLKAMMAGANIVEIASELIAHGPKRVTEILQGLETWMVEYEYRSIQQMRGSMSHKAVAEPAAFERANYMKALQSFDHKLV